MSTTAVEPGRAGRSEPTASARGGGGDVGRRDFGTRSGGTAGFSMMSLSWLAAGCGVTGLVLYAFQQALRLPSGYGVDDLLGWSEPATILAALQNWCPDNASGRWRAAVVYVLADTAFFMPFYGALILVASRGMTAALQPGTAPLARFFKSLLQPLSWLLVIALWIVDGVENFGGAQRVGVATWGYGVSVAIALALFLAFWHSVLAPPAQQKQDTCKNVTAVLVAVAVLALVVYAQDRTFGCDALRLPDGSEYGLAWAHRAKPYALLAALAPLAIAAVVWWFGIDLNLAVPAEKDLAQFRAAWRAGVAGVIGRTRYVLLMLGLFAAFTLVLDQCRDVLLALAGPRPKDAGVDEGAALWSVFVLGLGAVSIGMLAYACWMWTRLVVMVERPGLALPGGLDVYGQVGEFARGWARAMSLVPLVMFCLLLAHNAGDAAAAARAVPVLGTANALTSTLIYLAIFGVLTVLSGYAFLQIRRKLSLSNPWSYYNSEPDAYMLLRTGTTFPRGQALAVAAGIGGVVFEPIDRGCSKVLRSVMAPAFRLLQPLTRYVVPVTWPIVLPLVALGLMLVVRCAMAWWPDTTSQAPVTLVLLCLSLVWWMSVAGAISIAEQRQTIPWMLGLFGVAGVMGAMDLVNNHVMAVSRLAGGAGETLESLRSNGLWITGALTALSAVLWVALTYRPGTSKTDPTVRAWRQDERLTRSLIVLFVAGCLGVALHAVDGSTQRLLGPPVPASTSRPLDVVMTEWAARLPATPTSSDNRVYLVASEGGGVRSAYWTAQVLAQLHDRSDGVPFDSRTVVLSGVSGGAVGEAVYIACLRQTPTDGKVAECVREGFKRLDALSPLIGAFLFEDVFARVLPVRWKATPLLCAQPGCGFLSRALGFEREWMRRFPPLAEPLGRFRPGEPELMLNSTWVESGNRATLSTMRLRPRDTPAGEDVVHRLGAEPSLITSAHAAARFPFINPIAALEPTYGARRGEIVGHVADGGYHDNSGAESLSDVWRSLRAKLPLGWTPQLVLIRNGQVKPSCEKVRGKEPAPGCLAGTTRRNPDLATPLDKAQMGLYVDLLGPAVAVLNVSGIGARGRQAAGAMGAELASASAPASSPASAASARFAPCLLDQTNEATLVPLGWYLSPAARDALDRLAQSTVTSGTCR